MEKKKKVKKKEKKIKDVPNVIKVAGINFKVELKEKFRDDSCNNWGFCNPSKARILILTVYDGVELSTCTILASVLHEIVHAIDHVYLNGDLSEETVTILSDIVFHILSDNGLDFSGTIKILGKTYEIIDNYEFKDCDQSISLVVDESQLKILRSGYENSEVLRMCTLKCVLGSIFRNSSFLDEEIVDNFNFNAFSSGLFQVLNDSGLDDIIKGC